MWKLFDKLQLFVIHFFKGLKFAAFEYDTQLQRTVTSQQRVVIWMKIIIAGIFIIALFIFALRLIFSNFNNILSIFKPIFK